MLSLYPDRNTIYIDIDKKVCTIVGNGEKRAHSFRQSAIPQYVCVEIMKLAKEAGYSFNTEKAYPTKVLKPFFDTLQGGN